MAALPAAIWMERISSLASDFVVGWKGYREKTMASSNLAFSVMKHLILSGLCASIFLFSPPLFAQRPAPEPSPSPIPSPSQPPPASPNAPTAPVERSTPQAGGSPSSHLMRTWRRLNYTCDGGVKVVVNLHGRQARVLFKNRTYNMKQVDVPDGQKYVVGSLAWRNQDEIGTLVRTYKSGHKKSLAAGCHLRSAGTTPPREVAHPPADNPPQ
jgi:membrane-bound inhibitor of C-type lysozyme